MFPGPSVHTNTHIHTHARTHAHIVYTSSMGFRFDFFWTPARPAAAPVPSLPPPRPVPPPQTTYRTAARTSLPSPIVLFTGSPAGSGEDHQPCVCACVCAFMRLCACACALARGVMRRRGVRVHTPAQSTAPLQCSVGLRAVFTCRTYFVRPT